MLKKVVSFLRPVEIDGLAKTQFLAYLQKTLDHFDGANTGLGPCKLPY